MPKPNTSKSHQAQVPVTASQAVRVGRPLGVVGSVEQERIWDLLGATAYGPHVRSEAVAGSGKSFTLDVGARVSPFASGEKCYLAFNKDNQVEAEEKAGGPVRDGGRYHCKTYHSLGKDMVVERYPELRRMKLDDKRTRWLIGQLAKSGASLPGINELQARAGEKDWYFRLGVEKLVGHAKNTGAATDGELRGLVEAHDVEFVDPKRLGAGEAGVGELAELEAAGIKAAQGVLVASMEAHGQFGFLRSGIDFGDMLWLPYTLNLNGGGRRRFMLVLGDESQDLNAVQHWLLLNAGERVVFVGDSHQCHPPDTKVMLTGKITKSIKDLRVGDELVSYNSRKSYHPGVNSQGRKVTHLNVNQFDGELVVLHAGGKAVKVTPNHKILTRVRKSEGYILYLMVKGKHARVGVAQLQYGSVLGPVSRARAEKADALWMLDVFDSKAQALLAESIVCALYGLPDCVFLCNGQASMPQSTIDALYAALPSNLDRAEDCLDQFGRDIRYPIWQAGKDKNKKMQYYSFVTEACNLIDGVMEVRIFDGEDAHKGEWSTAYTTHEKYSGPVYGITVEPCEDGRRLYVADGIVVHNSIYGWRGASQDSMNLLERELKKLGPVVQANLTYTRRCPKSVVALAQRLVPHIQALPAAIEGEVRTQDKLVERDRETGAVGRRPELGSMVLCRTNAPLVEHAFALWKLGTPAFIKGKSTQKEVLDLVHRSEAGSINETLANAQRVVTEDVSRLLALEEGRGEVRASRLMDILECLDGAAKAVQPATDTWQLKEALNKLFGEGKPSHEVVVLSTVHRAKGLEADSVYVVGPELIPHKGAKKPWELDGERNVLYVAETRAKKELVFVGGRPKWAAQQ